MLATLLHRGNNAAEAHRRYVVPAKSTCAYRKLAL